MLDLQTKQILHPLHIKPLIKIEKYHTPSFSQERDGRVGFGVSPKFGEDGRNDNGVEEVGLAASCGAVKVEYVPRAEETVAREDLVNAVKVEFCCAL